jgi:hypothetical protein
LSATADFCSPSEAPADEMRRVNTSGNMRKTLLAVGFAVLVSMMLAPHGERSIAGWGPFFYSNGYFVPGRVGFYWTHPYYGYERKLMIDMLILQTIFLAVLFAVLVNIRWRRNPKQV